MKGVILYDSSDSDGVAVTEGLGAVPGVNWIPVDVAREKPAPCIGCFGCWTRTPGECVLPADAGSAFYGEVWNADYLLFVSRITWGGLSVPVKSYTDRILPLLHPYFRKVNGEMHHRLRYGRLPAFLSVGIGGADDAERETFRKYSEAQRDQSGLPRGRGCFVLETGVSDSAKANVAQWFRKEASL